MIHEECPYQNTVFMQGDDAVEPLDIQNKNGQKLLLEHLLQWDPGEPREVSRSPTWGTGDRFFVKPVRIFLPDNFRTSACSIADSVESEKE